LKKKIKENKQLFDSNILPVDMSSNTHHLAFLFSSPLVRKGKDGITNVMKIDYK